MKTMKKISRFITLFIMFGVFTLSGWGADKDFFIEKSENLIGDITIIGNSVQCLTKEATKFGTQCDPNPSDHVSNDYYTKYIDIDNGDAILDKDSNATFNSSGSTLELPTGSEVVWAGLYWQGFLHECKLGNASCKFRFGTTYVTGNDITPNNIDADKIKLFTPNNGVNDYETITSTQVYYTYNNSASGTTYGAFAEITNKLNKTNPNGKYIVADLQSMEGKWGYGNFAAWSIVIIYKDPAGTLHNVTVSNGYKRIYSSSVDIKISGFLTPSKGLINSRLVLFAGEGEDKYTNDYITVGGTTNYVSNATNPSNSIFNSTVSSGVPDPVLTNYNGIDIDSFDTGRFMTNGQTNITLNIGSTKTKIENKSASSIQDAFYPSMIAFSTELYIPDVCYVEEVSFNNQPITDSNLPQNGDNVEYTVDITNKNNEPAKGILIEKKFDSTNDIKYVPNSMSIAPIPGTTFSPKTDAIGDDTAEYSADAKIIKLLLGSGATSSAGGTIDKDALTKFKYSAEVGDQNASENSYLVSYRNDLLNITFTGVPIRKCVDFNNSFGVYIPVIGKYNTVRSNSGINLNTGPDPIEPLDAKNALYTQIVNKPFDVHVISFNNDNITPLAWSGDLNLSIVELSDSGDCSDANILLSNVYELKFSNEKYKEANGVVATKASRNALFKMVTDKATVCSRDSFAIRPETFNIDTNETGALVGNRLYDFTFTAAQDGLPSLNYTQVIHNSLDKNATTQLIVPVGCALPTPVEFTNVAIPFVDGQVSALIKYSNIGKIELKLSDQQWAFADMDSAKGDCIVGSAENNPDTDGRVGCMIQGVKTFDFVPEKFASTLSLANGSNDATFTYISNGQEISAPLTLTATATLDGGATATNYTAKCFSRDITTKVNLADNQNLSWSDSQTRVKFFDDLNISSQLITQVGSLATFSTTEGNFTNGSSDVAFRINFQRDQTKTDNPFNIAKNDFDITMIDTDGTKGNDFNRTNDMNATFVYGRANASKQRYQGNGGDANIYFESFCFGATCNKELLPNGANSRRINDARWFINDNHNTATDGNVTAVKQKDGAFVTATPIIDANPSITTLQYNGARGYPYKTTMQIDASPWLIYNENEFDVEFDSSSGWSGKHETDTTTKNNSSSSTNRRVIW